MIEEYKVVASHRASLLAKEVNKHIKKGWHIAGGIAIGPDDFCYQAMIKLDIKLSHLHPKTN